MGRWRTSSRRRARSRAPTCAAIARCRFRTSAGVAAATHLHAVVREDDDDSGTKEFSTWAVLAADDSRLDALRRLPDWRPLVGRAGTTWTDSYSNMVNILELG